MNDLLRKRIKEYGIPDLPAQPLWDKVAVWMIPVEESKTAGGLFVPDIAQGIIKTRGVLLAAGLSALDKLYGYGVEPGHIVWWGRYAGDTKTVAEREAGTREGKQVLMLSAHELTGCEDLRADLQAGRLNITRDAEGRHFVSDGDSNRQRPSDDKEAA